MDYKANQGLVGDFGHVKRGDIINGLSPSQAKALCAKGLISPVKQVKATLQKTDKKAAQKPAAAKS